MEYLFIYMFTIIGIPILLYTKYIISKYNFYGKEVFTLKKLENKNCINHCLYCLPQRALKNTERKNSVILNVLSDCHFDQCQMNFHTLLQ